MNTHHRTRPIRRFALLLSLLLAPALSAEAQRANAARADGAQNEAQAAPASSGASGVVNLNTASLQELTRLPGVGPSRAQAILDLRARMKGFKRIEDLMRVRGIGRKTFRKLQPMLRLEGATTLETRAPRRTSQPTAQR